MNWLQKSSQSWSDMHDDLGTAQDIIGYRDEIPDLKREVGDIPEQTCPLINKVIREINNVLWALKRGDFDSIEGELWDTEDELETIRQHNNQLRELGKYWYEQYAATEEKIQELESHLQYCRQMCEPEVANLGTSPINPV